MSSRLNSVPVNITPVVDLYKKQDDSVINSFIDKPSLGMSQQDAIKQLGFPDYVRYFTASNKSYFVNDYYSYKIALAKNKPDKIEFVYTFLVCYGEKNDYYNVYHLLFSDNKLIKTNKEKLNITNYPNTLTK